MYPCGMGAKKRTVSSSCCGAMWTAEQHTTCMFDLMLRSWVGPKIAMRREVGIERLKLHDPDYADKVV